MPMSGRSGLVSPMMMWSTATSEMMIGWNTCSVDVIRISTALTASVMRYGPSHPNNRRSSDRLSTAPDSSASNIE